MKRKSNFLFFYFAIMLISNLTFASEPSWKTYRNNKSHIEFIYPSTWSYESCISGYKNAPDRLCIGFQSVPLKNAAKEDYDILFELRPLSLEGTLADDLSFDKTGDQWFKYSMFGTLPAKKISGKNWQGIYVVGGCKDSDDPESHAAGDCLMAILSQNNRSAIFETSSASATEIVLTSIIPSFQFLN